MLKAKMMSRMIAIQKETILMVLVGFGIGAIHKPRSHFLGDFGPPLPPNVDTFTPMT